MESLMSKSVTIPELMKLEHREPKQVKRSRNRANPSRQRRLERRRLEREKVEQDKAEAEREKQERRKQAKRNQPSRLKRNRKFKAQKERYGWLQPKEPEVQTWIEVDGRYRPGIDYNKQLLIQIDVKEPDYRNVSMLPDDPRRQRDIALG